MNCNRRAESAAPAAPPERGTAPSAAAVAALTPHMAEKCVYEG